MSKLTRWINNLKKVNETQELIRVLSDPYVQARIVELNQEQLYEYGVQADGTPTGEYAPITVHYYKPLAASEGRDGRTDHITGKDTGETYKSMRVELGGYTVTITAQDENNFFATFEPKGLGLTRKSMAEVIGDVKPQLIEAVQKKMFK